MAKGATLLASSHPHGWGHQYCTFLGQLEGPIYMWESVELFPFWWYLREFPSLLLKVLYICLPHENISPWLFIDVSVVSRIESSHRGNFLNTCRMNVFSHCVWWYCHQPMVSLCQTHTRQQSRCQSLGGKKRLGEITDSSKAGPKCCRIWDTGLVIKDGSARILLPEPGLEFQFSITSDSSNPGVDPSLYSRVTDPKLRRAECFRGRNWGKAWQHFISWAPLVSATPVNRLESIGPCGAEWQFNC